MICPRGNHGVVVLLFVRHTDVLRVVEHRDGAAVESILSIGPEGPAHVHGFVSAARPSSKCSFRLKRSRITAGSCGLLQQRECRVRLVPDGIRTTRWRRHAADGGDRKENRRERRARQSQSSHPQQSTTNVGGMVKYDPAMSVTIRRSHEMSSSPTVGRFDGNSVGDGESCRLRTRRWRFGL